MVLMELDVIETRLPIAFELLKYYLKTSREDLFRDYEIFTHDGMLYGKLPRSREKVPIFITDDILQDFLLKEKIVVNIVGNYEGTGWGYFVFSNSSPIPKRLQTNLQTFKETQAEAWMAGLLTLNEMYTNLPKSMVLN